jgi:hypothetical protein
MLDVIALPTLPCLSDAPTTAIDFGERNTDSDIMMNSSTNFP